MRGWVRGWGQAGVCAYMYVCEWVSEWGGCFWTSRSSKRPYLCYRPLGLGAWRQGPETKRFVHFLEGQWTSVSVRVNEQWVGRKREGKRGMCTTVTWIKETRLHYCVAGLIQSFLLCFLPTIQLFYLHINIYSFLFFCHLHSTAASLRISHSTVVL